MTEWLTTFTTLDATDQLLALLIAAVAILLLLSFAFALLTLRLRVLNDRKAEHWSRLEATWEPLVLEVMVEALEPGAVQAAVSPRDRLPFLAFLLRYHRRVVGAEQQILEDLARPHLQLLVPHLRSASAEKRARAIQTLAELGLPDHLPAVIEALDDQSPIVVLIAAKAICGKQIVEGFPSVVNHLSAFSLWSVQYLVSMLVAAGPEVAPLLGAVISDETRPERERVVALDALRELHDLSALSYAAATLAEYDRGELVISALASIERLGFDDHAEIVRRFIHSNDPVVRAAALGALGSVGDERDEPMLVAAMDDDSAWVALEAARGLHALGARALLVGIASGDDDEATLAQQILAESPE